jgi:hypothetical protein
MRFGSSICTSDCRKWLNERTYIGADLGANNPVGELLSEASALFGANSKVAILLSLGSGHPGTISMPITDETRKSDIYRQIISDSEVLAEEIKKRVENAGIYFRFSVRQGMQKNDSTTSDEPGWIFAQASSYMKDEETITVVSCSVIQSTIAGC